MNLSFPHTEIFDRATNYFHATALEVFRFQYHANPVYQKFADSLKRSPENVSSVEQIPFLPVELFKTHRIYCAETPPEVTFTSSGTTGSITSRHEVAFKKLYEQSFHAGFTRVYGPPSDWIFLFLLQWGL